MFSKIIDKLRYKLLLSLIKPEIIAYKNFSGKNIKGTSVSNMCQISNKKNITIGENVLISHFTYIDGYRNVTIKNCCQIATHVSILTHSNHHNIRYNYNRIGDQNDILLTSGDVTIGENTFIGSHVLIQPGTEIGRCCIISSFSSLKGKYPDYSIIKGNPAKIVGSTKTIDDSYLDNHPEHLENHYNSNN